MIYLFKDDYASVARFRLRQEEEMDVAGDN